MTACTWCGHDAERIPTKDGWTCARCKSNFAATPEPDIIRVEVTSKEDGYGRSGFTASWHEDDGRIRAQVFHANLGFHMAQWKAQKKHVIITQALVEDAASRG